MPSSPIALPLPLLLLLLCFTKSPTMQLIISSLSILAAIGTVVFSAVAGAALYALWVKRASHKSKLIPKEWPLNQRLLANTEERRVWSWMCKVFYDHHIMVKIPITRFTLPRQPEEGQHWYNLLGSVYCTLTICGSDGRVIGCVDVLGRKGLSRSNQRLKRSLLAQCGMAYLVIEPGTLLVTAQIRSLFLGEEAALSYARDSDNDETIIAAARHKLSSVLDRQRRSRSCIPKRTSSNVSSSPESRFSDESSYGSDSTFGTSTEFSSEWQKNSFMAPLDSRRDDLHR